MKAWKMDNKKSTKVWIVSQFITLMLRVLSKGILTCRIIQHQPVVSIVKVSISLCHRRAQPSIAMVMARQIMEMKLESRLISPGRASLIRRTIIKSLRSSLKMNLRALLKKLRLIARAAKAKYHRSAFQWPIPIQKASATPSKKRGLVALAEPANPWKETQMTRNRTMPSQRICSNEMKTRARKKRKDW